MKHCHQFGRVLLSSFLTLLTVGIFNVQVNAKQVQSNHTAVMIKSRPSSQCLRVGSHRSSNQNHNGRNQRNNRRKRTTRKRVHSHRKQRGSQKHKRNYRKPRRRKQQKNRRRSRTRRPFRHRKVIRKKRSVRRKRKINRKRSRPTRRSRRNSRRRSRRTRKVNRHRRNNDKTIKSRSVRIIGTLPYRNAVHHKKIPVLQKIQSVVVNPDGKSALIGYIGNNKKDDGEANVALRHGHVAIIWDSSHNHKFHLWDRRYRRKLGHMQSVTNYNNELAILNNPSGTITKGRIFLFNAHTLRPVKAYRIHVKNKHLGDSLAYDDQNHSFYDAYNEVNRIVMDKGNIQRHNGQSSVIFYRLPFEYPCIGMRHGLVVQSIAYDPKDDRLYIETSHRTNGDGFYGIFSVPVKDLNHKHPRTVKRYFLHRDLAHGNQEPEGISFDRHGNMYITLRHPERIFEISANQF